MTGKLFCVAAIAVGLAGPAVGQSERRQQEELESLRYRLWLQQQEQESRMWLQEFRQHLQEKQIGDLEWRQRLQENDRDWDRLQRRW
jgi:hypothetical protein